MKKSYDLRRRFHATERSQFSEFSLHRLLMKCRYNANVKELQDTAGSEYFKFLSRKAHEGASNQAKIDVANAQMIGNIGRCFPI